MKSLRIILFILFILPGTICTGQEIDSTQQWEFEAEFNAYIFSDDFIGMPVFRANKNKLHLEARYNYEDLETFSVWAGYNFTGGNELEYFITPMAGVIAGNSNGLAPGLEVTLTYKNFELWSESEFFIDPDSRENNFLYCLSDISYSILENFWIGISGQRTRLFQTDLELQRGILLGTSLKNWELNAYLYNFIDNEAFGLVSVNYTF